MSWSWSKTMMKPADVVKQANAFFETEFMRNLEPPERDLAMMVHNQIIVAAGAAIDGYLMNVSASGSQSMLIIDGVSRGANNNLTLQISFRQAPPAIEGLGEPATNQVDNNPAGD